MELALSVVALLVALGAAGLTFLLRSELDRARRAAEAAGGQAEQACRRAEESERALAALRSELDGARGELATIREQLEAPLPLTLPKGRSSRLDDLREQLRAAAQEEAEGEEA